MYNGMYFQPIKVSVNRARKYETSNQVDSKAVKSYQNKPENTVHDIIFQEYVNDLPLFEET